MKILWNLAALLAFVLLFFHSEIRSPSCSWDSSKICLDPHIGVTAVKLF